MFVGVLEYGTDWPRNKGKDKADEPERGKAQPEREEEEGERAEDEEGEVEHESISELFNSIGDERTGNFVPVDFGQGRAKEVGPNAC